MTTFKAILFLLSCLALFISVVQMALRAVVVIAQTICYKKVGNQSPTVLMTSYLWAGALSFTYIMAYLFIW